MEEVFQVRSEQLQHRDSIVDMVAVAENRGNAWAALERLVDFDLLGQQRGYNIVMF
jgi:hypothetical protein